MSLAGHSWSDQEIPDWPDLQGTQSPRCPLVLLYHSVFDSDIDPWGVRVQPAHFAEHVEIIARYCTPMKLADLDAAVRSGCVPPRAVAITFDDGYVDNLSIAKAVLEKFGVPATVFVASGYIDRREEFWWDDIDRLLLLPGTSKRSIRVAIGDVTIDGTIGADAWLPKARWKFQRWRNKYFAYESSPDHVARQTPRQRLHRPLWNALRCATSVAHREEALSSLRRQTTPATPARPQNMCVTAAQLRELCRGDLIDIGGHTHLHPSLGYLNRESQRSEIQTCKSVLEDLISKPVESFAYPFGNCDDYNDDSIEEVEAAGFHRACTNADPRRMFTPDVSRFEIPRHVVQNWSGPDFARALADRFQRFGGGNQ